MTNGDILVGGASVQAFPLSNALFANLQHPHVLLN